MDENNTGEGGYTLYHLTGPGNGYYTLDLDIPPGKIVDLHHGILPITTGLSREKGSSICRDLNAQLVRDLS